MSDLRKTFNVSLEIVMDGQNPLDVAKRLQEWIREDTNFQFYVQAQNEKDIHSVDLDEVDENAVSIANEYYTPVIKR